MFRSFTASLAAHYREKFRSSHDRRAVPDSVAPTEPVIVRPRQVWVLQRIVLPKAGAVAISHPHFGGDILPVYRSGQEHVLMPQGRMVHVFTTRLLAGRYAESHRFPVGSEFSGLTVAEWFEPVRTDHGALLALIGDEPYILDGFVVSQAGHSIAALYAANAGKVVTHVDC